MRQNQLLLTIICAALSANTFAFFCPNNFNQINIGDSQQTIDSLCGKPAKTTESEKQAEDNTPQEWSYFVKQDPSLGSVIPGNIKASIAFDQTGKVINMTINGLSVSTANFCGGSTVKIGSMRDTVKKSCGTPAYISKGESTGGEKSAPPAKVIEYQYDGTPPITLVFENGVLTEKK